VLQRWAPT